ncbi:dienelactone hydrolase family protein [Caulobacter sp. 17J80-11]|uniref:dienelactone hydrolase family protein n=1 Tax=Caulobacter sp. 17J80-11 TaxID=2763502 RepID=UPI001653AD5C|nr:dienelactone hydrolase family protein [Caulobacter sp. 17J80-11]MBC6983574.1 dienelactone hydrolase family protein [Caulobacter sp. 17J80-11]
MSSRRDFLLAGGAAAASGGSARAQTPRERHKLDTCAERWARLEPFTQVYGPDDDTPRPAVLLFHGCGGVRVHLSEYAEAAAAIGVRAFVVDSYSARGWSPEFGRAFVCTGAVFRGDQRAGDVLAAIKGVSQRPDVDPTRLAVAGWSHGGWGIMELMSSPLEHAGEIGLADPQDPDLSGVKGAFLAYPYVGFVATGRSRPWRRRPQTLGVIAKRDHLTTVRNARRVYDVVGGSGVPVEVWEAEGTHSFDERTGFGPMKYDPEVTAESVRRFTAFLRTGLDVTATTTA